MNRWSRRALDDILMFALMGIIVLVVLAVASFPVWAYYFNVLSFEWVVVVALTLILLDGGSE